MATGLGKHSEKYVKTFVLDKTIPSHTYGNAKLQLLKEKRGINVQNYIDDYLPLLCELLISK